MKTLIVGCSFCTTLCEKNSNQWTLSDNITVRATGGTGNQAMAARVLYECAENSYDQVIVIWSGINRLDAVITWALHATYPGAQERRPDYSFCTPIKDSVWYHSGGQAGSWTWDKTCPADIRQIFKTQYLGADSRYMSDISLSNIAYTQAFLEKQKIAYQMSFIYNPFFDYAGTPDEHHFGQVNQSSSYFKLVDWSRIKTNNTAFEWAKKETHALESDQLHPTRDAMKKWINLTFGIDIAQ
jgi:hypothetical protein